MANMLAVPTGEVSHPVAFVVLVVAADCSPHEFSVPMRSDGTRRQAWRQDLQGRQLPMSGSPDIGPDQTRSRGLLADRTLGPI